MQWNHRLGWYLFGVSGVVFILDGILSGEPLIVAASVLFTAGVALFLIPKDRGS